MKCLQFHSIAFSLEGLLSNIGPSCILFFLLAELIMYTYLFFICSLHVSPGFIACISARCCETLLNRQASAPIPVGIG